MFKIRESKIYKKKIEKIEKNLKTKFKKGKKL